MYCYLYSRQRGRIQSNSFSSFHVFCDNGTDAERVLTFEKKFTQTMVNVLDIMPNSEAHAPVLSGTLIRDRVV